MGQCEKEISNTCNCGGFELKVFMGQEGKLPRNTDMLLTR